MYVYSVVHLPEMAEGGDIKADCAEHNDRGQGFRHIARKRPTALCFTQTKAENV